MEEKKEQTTPLRHALRSALWVIAVIIGILIFAYGFAVTEINLEEPQDPKRQEVTTRVIRAIARPDFFEYRGRNAQHGCLNPYALPGGNFGGPDING